MPLHRATNIRHLDSSLDFVVDLTILQFFLRGTQLEQLSKEYDTCIENIQKTNKLLSVKKEALPDLKTRVKEASIRYDEANKAREQKQKAQDLKKELAWSHVASKQEELEKQLQEVSKLSRRLPKIEDSIKEAEASIVSLNVANIPDTRFRKKSSGLAPKWLRKRMNTRNWEPSVALTMRRKNFRLS